MVAARAQDLQESAATWPLADDPLGERMNTVPKLVASRTLGTVTWRNSTLLRGDAAEAVAARKRDEGGGIQGHGSSDLLQTLLAHDLVDEFQLRVPSGAGAGKTAVRGRDRTGHARTPPHRTASARRSAQPLHASRLARPRRDGAGNRQLVSGAP